MSEQINIRVEKKIVQDFEELANYEKLDRAALVRKVLLEGLNQERINFAIQKYVLQEISVERAAEIAGVSIHEFLNIMAKFGIPSNMSLEDYQKVL